MRLEDEIKQNKPFKTEFQKMIVNIHFTSSWLQSFFAKKIKQYGITPPQYNVLRILKGKYPGGYGNQEITERMLDKSSNATRIVDKLALKKLVTRTENKSDRRSVSIKITEKGIQLLKEIEKGEIGGMKELKPFNEEKAKLMNEWLDELRG